MWQVIPEAVLPSPLTFEAVLNAKSQLSIVLGINRRIFIKNSSGQEQKLPSGTVIAGWFKGKFWHYRRDGSSGQAHAKKSKKSAEEEITETTDADVLFSLKDASSVVAVNGKAITLAELFAERRKTHPDAAVQYHKLQDKPSPGAPGWFELQTEVSIYFRGEDIPAKGEEQGVPKLPMHHLAGAVKASCWNTPVSQVTWAVKWSQTSAKGLTPVRPMVLTTVPLLIPPKSAAELTQSDPEASAPMET